MSLGEGQEASIPLWVFLLGAAVVVAGAFAAVWFAFPGPDTRHRLVSPSGNAALELGELCTENGCNRVAIFDAAGTRRGCPLDLPGNRPVFDAVDAEWTAVEDAVVVRYTAPDGATGTISFERGGCTLTE